MIKTMANLKETISRKTFGSAILHPHEYFTTEMALNRENVRSLFRGYLRSYYQKDYIVAPPTKYPQLQNLHNKIPVLHYQDGQSNHFLLKRQSDDVFDLIVLEYSSIFNQFSGKSLETFSIDEFIRNARLANATKIVISLYDDGSFKLPKLTHLEIPIPAMAITSWLANRKKKEEEQHKMKISRMRGYGSKEEDALGKSNRKIQSLMQQIYTSKLEHEKILQEKRELVKMRLPYLEKKLKDAKTLEEITILVQGEIISKIYEPEPVPEHCPGRLDLDGRCYPTGQWDQKTWDLYRRLYRISDIAGEFYYNL